MYTSYFMLNFHRNISPLIESSSGVHNSNTYMICEYGFSLKYAANILPPCARCYDTVQVTDWPINFYPIYI